MTNEQLNHEVAKIVMLWGPTSRPCVSAIGGPEYIWHGFVDSRGIFRATEDEATHNAFHPATNMAHAWEVVEHLREFGYIFRIGTPKILAEWEASFTHPNRCGGVSRDGIATWAICMAALEAAGV